MSYFRETKTATKTGIKFSSGGLGGVNFDFVYLNEGNKRTDRLIKYWNNIQHDLLKKWKSHIGNYKSPIGYASWTWVNNFLVQFLTDEMLSTARQYLKKKGALDKPYLDTIEETIILATSLICSNLQPIYLTREFTEDLARTDFKGFDAAPNDIYPVYTFMLPKSSVNQHNMALHGDENLTDDFYTIIAITHNHYRDTLHNTYKTINNDDLEDAGVLKNILDKEAYPPGDPRLSIFKPGFKILALSSKAAWCVGDFVWEEGTKDWKVILDKKNLKIQLDRLPNFDVDTKGCDCCQGEGYLSLDNTPNQDVFKNLLNIAANSILLMDHQPEYITEQSPMLGGRGFKDDNPPKPSTWLGENYEGQKIRYEYPPDYVPTEGKSPRSHWRRGHMRHVCQGKGRKQKVLTWIKPVFIVGRGAE